MRKKYLFLLCSYAIAELTCSTADTPFAHAKIDDHTKFPQCHVAVRGRSMADDKEGKVSRHDFSVAYDGEDRVGQHSIDVENLAPALLAFGKLIREANVEFNGKKSSAKVSVVSDFEAKCFHINFEVVVSLFDQLKTLLDSPGPSTAKTILEWLGLLGITGGSGTLTYLGYLKWKRGRKVEVRRIEDSDHTGTVEVRIEGEHNSVQIHNHVYNLSENPRALRATRDAFLPLGQDGFEVLRLKEGETTLDEIDTSDVESIVASCNVGIEQAKETEPEVETTSAWLSVYSPVYDATAENWRFRLGTNVIYADITQTTIAADALERGGAMADDSYQVRLEITTEIDGKGNRKQPQYKILSVVRFVPASPAVQTSLFGGSDQR